MATHRYRIGQAVQFAAPNRRVGRSGVGQYTVVRLLPEEGGTPQYRIKSAAEGTERVVLESQLTRPII